MSTQQRVIQPAVKDGSDTEQHVRENLRRETGLLAFLRRSILGEKSPAPGDAQDRWRRILTDARELEKSCSMAHERLMSADRAKDPEQAAADLAEADVYLHRASQLIVALDKLKRGFRAPFQFNQSAQRRIKDFTRAAATLRIDRDAVEQGETHVQEQGNQSDQERNESVDTTEQQRVGVRRRR